MWGRGSASSAGKRQGTEAAYENTARQGNFIVDAFFHAFPISFVLRCVRVIECGSECSLWRAAKMRPFDLSILCRLFSWPHCVTPTAG